MDSILKNYNPTLNIYDLNIDIEKYFEVNKNVDDLGHEELVGAVPKCYAKLDKKSKKLVEANSEDFEYILKFSDDYFVSDSANEHFFLWLSNKCNINTSNAELIETVNSFDEVDYMLLSKRFTNEKTNIIPFYELLTTSQDKEGLMLEDLYDAIEGISSLSKEKKEDIKIELFKQLLYSNTIGNYDLHLGNISFLTNSNMEIIDLAPTYDVLCTHIQIYGDGTKSTININGKHEDVEALDIIEISSKYIDIDKISHLAKNMYESLKENFPEIKNSYIDTFAKAEAIEYISKRISKLESSCDNYINLEKEINKATVTKKQDFGDILKEFNINDLKDLNLDLLRQIASQELANMQETKQDKSNGYIKEVEENKYYGVNL